MWNFLYAYVVGFQLDLLYLWSRLMSWKANLLHFWVVPSSHSAATQGSMLPCFEDYGVCFKSKGGKSGPGRHQVRGRKRHAMDWKETHKAYSKCPPNFVATTEAGKLGRK